MKNQYLIILIILTLLLPGCMTANQLIAEQSYYQAHASIERARLEVEKERIKADVARYENLQAYKTLEIKTVDPSRPIVLENVEINAFAMPQMPQQPIVINQAPTQPLAQYRQPDTVGQVLGFLGKVVPLGIGIYGAYKMLDVATSNSGTNMTNYGANSDLSMSGDRNVNMNGGTFNMESDLTHNPTIVTQPSPIIARPEVVNPVVVNQPEPIIVQ